MKKLQLKSGLLVQTIDEELIILDPSSDAYFGLNEVGLCIFNALEKSVSTDDIVQELVQTFEVDASLAQQDVLAFIEELVQSGLLVPA